MVRKAIGVCRKHGVKPALKSIRDNILLPGKRREYAAFLNSRLADKAEIEQQRNSGFHKDIRFQVLLAGHAIKENGQNDIQYAAAYCHMEKRLEKQSYPFVIMSTVDDAMKRTYTENDYLIVVTPDIRMNPSCCYEFAKKADELQGEAELMYADEVYVEIKKGDIRTGTGVEHVYAKELALKPDFSPHRLSDYNYMGNLVVIKAREMDEAAWAYIVQGNVWELNKKIASKVKNICHIPKILYASRGMQPDYISQSNLLKEADEEIEEFLKVSIIIPNCEHKKDLQRCISSILSKTDYPHYDIIIVENNSTSKEIFDYYQELTEQFPDKIRILNYEGSFNYSAVNNMAVRNTEADWVVLLNNDTEVIEPGWLKAMAGLVQKEEVGAAGACLLYQNRTIQHSGIIIGAGPDETAVHVNAGIPFEESGYGNSIHHICNYMAVTGACLMVSRADYYAAGEMDENLKVAYNDVDFCMKLWKAGKWNVYTPHALLYHYESQSRGSDKKGEKRLRFQEEASYFKNKWADVLKAGDPFYNENFSRSMPWTLKK